MSEEDWAKWVSERRQKCSVCMAYGRTGCLDPMQTVACSRWVVDIGEATPPKCCFAGCDAVATRSIGPGDDEDHYGGSVACDAHVSALIPRGGAFVTVVGGEQVHVGQLEKARDALAIEVGLLRRKEGV